MTDVAGRFKQFVWCKGQFLRNLANSIQHALREIRRCGGSLGGDYPTTFVGGDCVRERAADIDADYIGLGRILRHVAFR